MTRREHARYGRRGDEKGAADGDDLGTCGHDCFSDAATGGGAVLSTGPAWDRSGFSWGLATNVGGRDLTDVCQAVIRARVGSG